MATNRDCRSFPTNCRCKDSAFERTMHLILFFLFAGFCLAGAINLLLQTHPINSALSLIVVMTSLAVLYLLLGAEFLAVAQIIVYAGAVMVLFTFVVMLLNAGREERTLGSRAAAPSAFPPSSSFWPCSPPSFSAPGPRRRASRPGPHQRSRQIQSRRPQPGALPRTASAL